MSQDGRITGRVGQSQRSPTTSSFGCWWGCAAFDPPYILPTAFAFLLLALVGCSRDGRLAANGTITLDGKPLESGAITFQPAAGGSGHSAGGQIENGQFHLAAEHGLEPGNYSVVVQTFRLTGRTVVLPMGKVPERVMVTYNEAGKLDASVAAGAANQFDFRLTSVR
jgi:hypothetical protein